MWFVLLTVYIFEILCIFVFVVYCVVAFLLVMVRIFFIRCNCVYFELINNIIDNTTKYQTRTEELRKCVVFQNENLETEFPVEGHESVDDKLEVLTEKLTEKERTLQRSHCEIKNAERVLTDLEKKTSTCRDRYRSLMTELKKDVQKTEEEVKMLQNQISSLSVRREVLRNEAIKQQEEYQKMLNNFTKELENKNALFSSSSEKSRHPRVSSRALQ
ncbi:uncharacterized protein LOC128891798 isoform X1 [Hylaeus anthracinus]|uniref:uncharacterized protein LOC128891798 isoform X1 n=1 Tax=Hylaeus anthracinus TaxID=313031 RepID=UPI0023B8E3D2|nr:uncharacterized protein LOC128891798 isoform X1 [Hylaeus anthracinus]